ncbi:MAG: LysR family transcriptional regulator [Burkholderiaceae bacterium]|nr:LysR family transcriptional regulator [Burkholderiaceae bacterium]
MNAEEPSWELYRTFLAVMREGSLSGAARLLGITQPTAGRHLDALEAAMNMALFMRTQHGLSPTREALALRPFAEAMEAAGAALLRTAASQQGGVRGTVRITASEVIAVEVLPPMLADLRAQYPEMNIELVASDRMEDLLQRGADIAVRMTRPTQASLVARRVGDVVLGCFAHRDYLARRGVPEKLEDLAQFDLIGADQDNGFARQVLAELPFLRRELAALRCDNGLVMLAALRAGFGVGVCQVGLARRDPNLVQLFPQQISFRLDTWIAMHEDLRQTPVCKLAFAALVDGMSRYIEDAQTPSSPT